MADNAIDEALGINSPDGLYPFTRAIFDAPKDDAPRLIFADRLDESSNSGGHRLRWWTGAKAELLKAEIAKANRPVAYDSLRSEAEKLKKQHGPFACALACVAIREYQELRFPIDYKSFATYEDSELIQKQTNAAWLTVELIGCGVWSHSKLENSVDAVMKLSDAAMNLAGTAMKLADAEATNSTAVAMKSKEANTIWCFANAAMNSANAAMHLADAASGSVDIIQRPDQAVTKLVDVTRRLVDIAWSSAYVAARPATWDSIHTIMRAADIVVKRFALATFRWEGWKNMPLLSGEMPLLSGETWQR